MEIFERRLANAQASSPGERRWLYVPYDQLSARIGPLSRTKANEIGIVLIESTWKPRLRPYHKQKLALILANQRHFALEQANRGVRVHYVTTRHDYATALLEVADELGPMRVMRPAEHELRTNLRALVENGTLHQLDHEGWLTNADDFAEAGPSPGPWRMDAFYRAVRRRTGILMENGKPVGGKFSHDADNRKPWSGEPPAPEPPVFEPDEVTREVGKLVEGRFSDHPGRLDLAALPATEADAERLRVWARESCLEHFGPYEDAMSTHSSGIFHTRLSQLINLHRVLPSDVLQDALDADIPLNSREGFIRQVLGWREFVRHVHDATDGFRSIEGNGAADVEVARAPGSAGWERGSDQVPQASDTNGGPDGQDDLDGYGGAAPSILDANRPLPAAYWGQPSGLECLDRSVRQVLDEGWTHHIPRLMVLSNLATLLGVSPRDLTDWFWIAFVDAFDWVVEPNVLAMGTFGTGEVMTTKPYVSGAAYINRMSDYCDSCRFHPKKNCPVTSLYWAFLDRNQERLEGNRRMALPLGSLRKRSDQQRATDQETHERVWAALAEGESLEPPSS